eukprot:scaffold101037_cov21-Tisochrysis_lutea.AAC.1
MCAWKHTCKQSVLAWIQQGFNRNAEDVILCGSIRVLALLGPRCQKLPHCQQSQQDKQYSCPTRHAREYFLLGTLLCALQDMGEHVNSKTLAHGRALAYDHSLLGTLPCALQHMGRDSLTKTFTQQRFHYQGRALTHRHSLLGTLM